ncbi:serine hydrolase [Leptospira sp. 2 VSF19]|uniref:Serine hydrolase n=1 Tax=Leptospira soteropolitanensis TaxID=2950025 RepID=A0AAW5VTB6_9LEPT|nr:serine hydrolase [Leptospira soteropolitanensis]MCW7494354.1 serine hydrolase [Leptospira soteropolitanensis]MCW7501937.1 serine hydrolase [Leptospira soteropolitanensis]MCW7524200.1 serine hydrolase [Leptospira soteropolitanensis]MCW7528065.1 serine hydrolase [Leptospira soteropolitanensis]MCW7531919.1 serine hydrolase [Leptospira soteropolitanensis]
MKPRSSKNTESSVNSSTKNKNKKKEESLLPFHSLPLFFPLPVSLNRKSKSFFLILNIFIFLQCSSLQEKPKEVYHNDKTTTEKVVLSKIEDVKNSGIKSLSYMYLLGDGVVHSGFLGVDKKGQVQRFKIGSITKLFTGIALLQLQESGKLKLDDPVSIYLPEVVGMPSRGQNYREITIRDILTHQSGFPSDRASGFFLSPDTKDPEILAAFRSLPQTLSQMERNEPGKAHSYSNFGFGLLGIVIERTSGIGIEEYFQKYLFSKAGMKHSTLLELNDDSELVSGYSGLFWKTETRRPVIRDLTAGSLSSTGEDMGLFLKALFQSKRGNGLLSASSFSEFHQIQKGPNSNFQMKLGLPVLIEEMKSGEKSIWISGHSGSLPPFFADLIYDPESETASFLVGNTLSFGTASIRPANKDILEIAYEYKTGLKLESPPLSERNIQNKLDGFYGLYVSPLGIHEVKPGNPSKIEMMGFDFDLVEKDNRFGANLRLFFGLIPIKEKTLESMRIEFEPWEGHPIFTMYSLNAAKGSWGFGVMIQPNHRVPEKTFFTTYQTNDPFSLISRVELKEDKRGFIHATVYYSLGGMENSNQFPCQLESESTLRILGFGRNLGERMDLKKVDGKPVLMYSGIEFLGR